MRNGWDIDDSALDELFNLRLGESKEDLLTGIVERAQRVVDIMAEVYTELGRVWNKPVVDIKVLYRGGKLCI